MRWEEKKGRVGLMGRVRKMDKIDGSKLKTKKKTGVEPNEGQKTQAEPHPMLDNVRRTYLAFTYL